MRDIPSKTSIGVNCDVLIGGWTRPAHAISRNLRVNREVGPHLKASIFLAQPDGSGSFAVFVAEFVRIPG